jgi:RHS repeat-associated protein
MPYTFYTTSTAGGSCRNSGTAQAADDSGFTINVTGETVNSIYTRSGIKVAWPTVTDSNGNTITYSGTGTGFAYNDTMSLQGVTVNSSTPSYNWIDENANTQTLTQTFTSKTLETYFQCGGLTDIPGTTAYNMTTGFSFPDGTSMGFAYELTPSHTGNVTGRINQITLREGGTVSYSYGGGFNGIDCTYQTVPVLTRTLGNGDITTYTLTHNSLGSGKYNAVNTVVDPGGNKTVYTFTGFSSTGVGAPPMAQVLTDVKRYQGSSTLLEEEAYCYNTAFSSCSFSSAPSTSASSPITSVVVIRKLGTMSTTSATETHYDSYGNVTYAAEYGFGSTGPDKATTVTYYEVGTPCGALSSGSNVNDRPCESVTAQGGSTVADSKYSYDQYGNLKTTSLWTGSTWIGQTSPNTYNSNGTPGVTYDVANNPTTYSYLSSYYLGCSTSAGTCSQYPFPTEISKGGLNTYTLWYALGGVRGADEDANGNETQFGYTFGGPADPYWRTLWTTDPYGSLVSIVYPTGSSPTTSSRSFEFNSSNSINNTTTTVDGYGRQVLSQTAQSPTGTNYDTVSTAYSWYGNYRRVASSQPCSTTSGSGCSVVHTNYLDPLGRLYQHITTYNEELTHTYTQNDDLSVLSFPPSGENNKQVQTQYDGLGRPTSVCAISSVVSGNVSCGQNTNTSATGVLTTTSYTSATGRQTVSSTRGSQTRSQTYDALGRITSITTPEGGMTTNVYDSAPSSCNGQASAHAGKLIYTGYANGNYSCYQYDSLGRITAVTGNSGSGGGPVCRRFYYDNSSGVLGALPSGISPQNPVGRMVEAETDTCTWPVTSSSMITDEWFSYDKDGRMTDMWELTPHSGTYYHSHATFAGNGAPLTVQLANPNLYTETYGLDGEGRLATLSSSGTTIVAGTTYNASSQPTYIDLGNGTDQSDYGWDPNTGRMKNWTFHVGNASETGTLTWNANGTLRQLAIVDGFNSGGSQTCNFGTSTVMGYDDLGRLLSDDCGSVWQQTFSYDQYDNITKSGSSAWNPGYYAANNHYSSGASYDNSGNVTSDPSHTYKWDSFNKLQSIDSSSCGSNGECVTYDALGRIVETSYNGVYTEIWYTQLGKTVYMHGSTPQYAYWPTPGKGTVEVNGNNSTFYYMHKDWLGNSRISSVIGSAQVVSDQAYAPYGEVYNKQATGASTPAQMFTGETQDVIGGIFDTPNRELNASQGRWLSLDPAHSGWNQYAYATNPLSYVDRLGLNDEADIWCGEDDCGGGGGGGGDGGSGGGDGGSGGGGDGGSGGGGDGGGGNGGGPNSGGPPVVTIGNDGSVLCPGSCPGLAMIQNDASSLVNPQDGSVTLLGGAAQVTETSYDGPFVTSSTGDQSLQLVPGWGNTFDLTVPAPAANPGPSGNLSAGTPVVSGSVNFANGSVTGATASVGFVISPNVPGGLNTSGSMSTMQVIGNWVTNAFNSYINFSLEWF